jgi:hypothetical protein
MNLILKIYDYVLHCLLYNSDIKNITNQLANQPTLVYYIRRCHAACNGICEISSSHGGEYDVQSCLLGYTVDNHFTRQYNPEDNSEHGIV